MPRRERYHHGDLRAALLRAATEQLDAGGAASFSLRDAARAAGVSPSAVYRHFTDRDALLASLARDGFDELGTAMRRAVDAADGDPVGRLEAVGEAYVAFATANRAVFRVMFGPWGAGASALRARDGEPPSESYRLLAQGLDGLVDAGILTRCAREGAELPLWSAVHGLATLMVDGPVIVEGADARATTTRRVVRSAIAGVIHATRSDAVTPPSADVRRA